MDLSRYLWLNRGCYDNVLELIRYSRDVASGQTRFKNYLLDISEHLRSGNQVSLQGCIVSSVEELDAFFSRQFVAWEGLDQETAKAIKAPVDYGSVGGSTTDIGSDGLLDGQGCKGMAYAAYNVYARSTSVSWMGNESYLLDAIPEVGVTYTVIAPCDFGNKEVSLLYRNPLTEYNGIETLQDIEDLRICRCDTRNATPKGEWWSIEVRVNSVSPLIDFSRRPCLDYEYGDFWYQFWPAKSRYIKSLGDFVVASVDVEGDIGVDYVFIRKQESLFLLMIQENGVGQPVFQYFVNYEIEDTMIKPAIMSL